MDDRQIIELYNQRDENAIKETSDKYGKYCFDEVCTMSIGPTSGLFTFTFNVRQIGTGEVEYHTVIYSQWYDLSFQKGSDGITRVQGITQGENPITRLFDISIKDGNVYLTENGVYIAEIN